MSETKAPDLLPCPFCGGDPWTERAGTRRYSTVIACTNCGARHESADQDECVGMSWNRRDGAAPAAPSVAGSEGRLLSVDEIMSCVESANAQGLSPRSMAFEAIRLAELLIARRVAELEKDAERYQWMRKSWVNRGPSYYQPKLEWYLPIAYEGQIADRLDAAIDSARAKGKP